MHAAHRLRAKLRRSCTGRLFVVVTGLALGAMGCSAVSDDAQSPSTSTARPPHLTAVTGTHHAHRQNRAHRHPRHVAAPTSPTTAGPPRPRRSHHKPMRAVGVPAAAVPIASLTPGAILTTSAATVCVSGYSSSVRDVPDSLKEQAYARYHVVHVPYAHEVDHLISLELGGSNDITNLWPEPYAGRWGARTKDVLENAMHSLVCSGDLELRRAQRMEATDWVAAYKKYVGTPDPVQPTSSPPSTEPSSRPGHCARGYSPCLPVVGDLDCGDLSSDQTPVTVTGSDPYALDADGDGAGCES
jgi:hypothetical protein